MRQDGRPAVLLQQRAEHDSYARACQVTTHGKLTEGEIKLDESTALSTAIGRKLREEVGEVAAEMIEAAKNNPVELERFVNSKGRLVITQGVDINYDVLAFRKLLVPGIDVGGFKVCEDPNVILPLEDVHKASGVPSEDIRMFKDEILAVKKFFK